ncbi:C-type lectin domain family 12 member A-like [Kryptolebias marmoratus]|uniref:C-type lectin domain family 12 member A-like n=1 Tax=Kryptolebias marmoratus TaxID=37003 RepID=A0A3Q2ZJP8_KRYMA|nr:C-type lectin domain family 12 member A-like [Kryptolebias marmoratus]
MDKGDANYSTLVFKNKAAGLTDETENQTVYSEVKSKKQMTAAPRGEEEQKIIPEVKQEDSGTTAPKAETAAKCSSRVLLVCLGTLCALLVAAIIVLSVKISMDMKNQEETNNNLTNKYKQLTEENNNLLKENERLMNNNTFLTNQTEQLSRERDDLNLILEVILTFDPFPVKTKCPNKKCQLCQDQWILFQGKCYFFFNETDWKTWNESRQFCQNKSADLVVVDNLQEQEFLGNRTKFYHDKWHGFWLGLQRINNTWVWVDGHEDTLGFWESQYDKDYGLLVPEAPPTQSWRPEMLTSLQKFICERKALIWPN